MKTNLKMLLVGLLWMPFLFGHTRSPNTPDQISQAYQNSCYWQFTSDVEAIATTNNVSGVRATREGNRIKTEYVHDGNIGCNKQTLLTTHTWTQPPARIMPGQKIDFNVNASWELSGLPACTALTVGLHTYLMAGTTTIKTERNKILLSKETNGSVANSGSWTAPVGTKEGAVMTITANANTGIGGGSVMYNYRYTCQPLQTLTPTKTVAKTSTITQTSQPPIVCPCPSEQGGDSGARFSDFSGEVTVSFCNHKDKETPAEIDMVLERGDYIKTEAESSAIISFADMTTFAMKPFTTVFLECRPPKETKFQLLTGKIWVNVKKMIKDGTVSVSLSQAVAGTKGTTFVVEDTGLISTLKVIEGSLSFTSRATGESIDVKTGESISANAKGMTTIVPFDVAGEITLWPEVSKRTTSESDRNIQPSTSGGNLPVYLAGIAVACTAGIILLFLAGLGVFWMLRKNK